MSYNFFEQGGDWNYDYDYDDYNNYQYDYYESYTDALGEFMNEYYENSDDEFADDIFYMEDFEVNEKRYDYDLGYWKFDEYDMESFYDQVTDDEIGNFDNSGPISVGQVVKARNDRPPETASPTKQFFSNIAKRMAKAFTQKLTKDKDWYHVNDIEILSWGKDSSRPANWQWSPTLKKWVDTDYLVGAANYRFLGANTSVKYPVYGTIVWNPNTEQAEVLKTQVVVPKNPDIYSLSEWESYTEGINAVLANSNTVKISGDDLKNIEDGAQGAEDALNKSIQDELSKFDLSEKAPLPEINQLDLELPEIASKIDIKFVVPEDGQEGEEGFQADSSFVDELSEAIVSHDRAELDSEYQDAQDVYLHEIDELGSHVEQMEAEQEEDKERIDELLGQQEIDEGKINELTTKVDSLEVQLKNAEDAEQIAIQNGNTKLAEEVARHKETIEKAAADAQQAKTQYENSLQQKDDAAEEQRKQLQAKIDEAVKAGQDAVKAAEDAAKTDLQNQKSQYEQQLTDAATAAQTAQQIAVEDAIKVERAQAAADAAIAEGKSQAEIAAKQKEVDDAKDELTQSQTDLSTARANYQTAENNYQAQLKINQDLNDTLTGEKNLRTAAENEAKRLDNELAAKQSLLDIATLTKTTLAASLSAAEQATQDAIAAGNQAAIEAAQDKERALKELSAQNAKDVKAKQDEIDNLNITLQEHKDQAAIDLKSINDLTSERDSLVTERDDIQAKLDEAKQATQDAIDAGDEQARAISEAAAEQLKLRMAEKDGELQSKQAELNSANTRADNLQIQVDGLKTQRTTLENQKKALEDQLSIAEQATLDAEAKGQDDVAEAERLAAENLANQIKAKDDEIGVIQGKLDESVLEEAKLTGEVDDLKIQNTDLSNTIRDRDNRIKLLESDKLSLESQLTAANKATEDAKAEGQADVAEAQRLAAQELENKIAEKDAKIKEEQDKLTAEKEKLRKANIEVSRLLGVETGLRQDIIAIRSELTSEENKLSSMTGERDELAAKLSEEENKLSNMTGERDSLQSQLDQARIDITTAVNEGNTKLQQEQERAAKELEDAIAGKDNEINGLKTTIDQKNTRIGELDNEIISKGNTIEDLNNQLIAADTQIGELELEAERLTQKNIDDITAQATQFAKDLDAALASQKTTLDAQKADELSAQADQFAKDLKTALEEQNTTLSAEHEQNLQDQADKLNKAKQDALDAQGTELEAEKNAALQQQAQNLADAQQKALDDQAEVLGQEKTDALAAQKTQLEGEFSTKLSSELAAQLEQLQQAHQEALDALGTKLEAEKNAALVEQAKNLADAQQKALEDQRGDLEQEKADALAAQADQFSQDLQGALSSQATSLRADFDIEKAKALQEQSTKFQEDLTNALSEQGVSLRGEFDVEKANALSAQATQFEQDLTNALAEQGATLSSEKLDALNAQRIELENAAQEALDAQGTELEAEKQKALSEQATRLADAQQKALDEQAEVLNQQKLDALSAQKTQLEGEAAADKANALANAATEYNKALEDALAAQGTELEQEKLDALALQAQQLATAQQNALDEQEGVLDQEKLDALTEQKNTYENIITGLEGQLVDAKTTIGQRDTEIIDLGNQISENQTTIDGLETDVINLGNQLTAAKKATEDAIASGNQALIDQAKDAEDALNEAITEKNNQLDSFTKRNTELINERDEALRLAEGTSLGLPSFAEDIYDEGINDRIFGDMFTSAFATQLPELEAPTVDIHYADLDAAEQAHEDFLNDSRFEYNSWKFGQAQKQLAEFADSKPDKFAEMGQKINDLLMVGDMDPMTKAESYLDMVTNNLVFGAGMSPMQSLAMGINTIEGTLGINLTDVPSLGRLSSNILEKFGSVVPDEIKNLFDRFTPDSVKNNLNATTGYLNQNFNFWDNLLADPSYSSQIRAGLPPSVQAVEEYQEKMWNALMVDPATGQPAFPYSDLKEEDKLSWAQQGLDFLNNLGGTTKTIVVDGQEFEVPKNLEGESWLGKFAAPAAGGIDLLGEGISKTTGFLEDLAFQQKKLTGGFLPNMAANALLGAATGVPLPWNNMLSFLLTPFAPQGQDLSNYLAEKGITNPTMRDISYWGGGKLEEIPENYWEAGGGWNTEDNFFSRLFGADTEIGQIASGDQGIIDFLTGLPSDAFNNIFGEGTVIDDIFGGTGEEGTGTGAGETGTGTGGVGDTGDIFGGTGDTGDTGDIFGDTGGTGGTGDTTGGTDTTVDTGDTTGGTTGGTGGTIDGNGNIFNTGYNMADTTRYDPAYELANLMLGSDAAQEYAGQGLSSDMVQDMINQYRESVNTAAFNEQARLLGGEQNVVNQMREKQTQFDKAMMDVYGQQFGDAYRGLDPTGSAALQSQADLSQQLYGRAKEGLTQEQEIKAYEQAAKMGTAQGRGRDVKTLVDAAYNREDMRALNEQRAQAAGAQAFNMSRQMNQPIAGMLLGGTKPYEAGMGQLDVINPVQNLMSIAASNFQNAASQGQYNTALNALNSAYDQAKQSDDQSTMDKISNILNQFTAGLATVGQVKEAIDSIPEAYQDVKDIITGIPDAVSNIGSALTNSLDFSGGQQQASTGIGASDALAILNTSNYGLGQYNPSSVGSTYEIGSDLSDMSKSYYDTDGTLVMPDFGVTAYQTPTGTFSGTNYGTVNTADLIGSSSGTDVFVNQAVDKSMEKILGQMYGGQERNIWSGGW